MLTRAKADDKIATLNDVLDRSLSKLLVRRRTCCKLRHCMDCSSVKNDSKKESSLMDGETIARKDCLSTGNFAFASNDSQ